MSPMRKLRHSIAKCLAQVFTAQQGLAQDLNPDLGGEYDHLGRPGHGGGSHIGGWARGPFTSPSRCHPYSPAGQGPAPTEPNKQRRTVVLSGNSSLSLEQVKHAPATSLTFVIGSVSPWVAAVGSFVHPALNMEPDTPRASTGICGIKEREASREN